MSRKQALPQDENQTIQWTCSTTRLVVSQVLQFLGFQPAKLLFLIGSC
jgi:hypothetical protein